MLDALVGTLAWLWSFAQPLGWAVVVAFAAGAVLEQYDREYARRAFVVAWCLFALFWFSAIYYFVFEQKSVIEGVGTIVAVPLSLYVAYLLASGRDSLFVLSRAVAAMGLIYLPFVTVPVLRETAIEMVTDQTQFVINLLGFDPQVASGTTITVDGQTWEITDKIYPYESTFVFYVDGEPVTYNILIACTGIGSMAIIAGLIAAVEAPLDRKLAALAVSIPVIYVLNIARNVFIALSLGKQAFHVFPDLIVSLFALRDPKLVSYIVADRIISQSLSVVALVVILWLVVKRLPEVLVVVEDAIYLFTGREYDMQEALDVTRSEAAD